MYKAIVVDDESVIRRGITSFISKWDTRFEVAAAFEDGSSAIEYLENNDAELVISDVKMSNVSGLGLAQYIYENKPGTIVLILSGYAEFDYAQTAMKYNVREYLTKPTNFSELKKILLDIKDELDAAKPYDIDEFLDKIKQLYTTLLSGGKDDSRTLMKQLLDSNKHDGAYLGRYTCNIFEIVTDHLAALLGDLSLSDKTPFEYIAELTDKEQIYISAYKALDGLYETLHEDGADTDDTVISKLLQYINENFSKNITLGDIANKVFFAPAYCSRFFKEKTGKNFSDYLLEVRMRHALELLRHDKKISDVAKACGYSSSNYFSRVFRDYYHCAPSDYLRIS